MENYRSITKISRPSLPHVFPRERLFRMLDDGGSYPVTWIAGPPGSGKTTLIASYLYSRKLPGIWYQVDERDNDIVAFFHYMTLAAKKATPRIKRPLPMLPPGGDVATFALGYFESLYTRLKPPYSLVFDNYQDVSNDSPFYEMVRVGLSILPEGLRALVVSRSQPPAELSGMIAGNKLFSIGWRHLKLASEESEGIATLLGVARLERDGAAWMHEKAQGWAAGLVLLAHLLKTEGREPGSMEDVPPEQVFEFFANAFFDRLDPSIQDFLRRTSFLRRLTPRAAVELTGNEDAGQILADLNRSNYFTEKLLQKELSYQYHALFREFLRHRAQVEYPASAIAAICRDATRILEAMDEQEEAAELCIECQNWLELVPLVLKNAPEFMQQGRSATIARWILAVPAEVRESDGWLMYWQGLCALVAHPSQARSHLERAYALFLSQGDHAGVFLSWAGVIDTYIHEFDHFIPMRSWIRKLKGLLSRGWEFPSPEIEVAVTIGMFNALFFMQPDDPDLPIWEQKMLGLMKNSPDPTQRLSLGSYLIMYYSWTGDIGRMGAIRAELASCSDDGGGPAVQLVWFTLDSVYRWHTAEFEQGLDTVQRALETARNVGAHAWDMRLLVQGVHCALGLGDTDTAGAYLKRVGAILNLRQRLDVAQFLYAKAYYHTVLGDLDTARECAEKAVALAEESGPVFPIGLASTGLAQILILQGRYGEAVSRIKRAQQAGKQMGSLSVGLKVSLLNAQIALARGDEARAIRSLQRAFATAREKGYRSLDWWLPAVMASLCEKALEHDVETDYIQALVRKHRLIPAEPPYHVDSWPWQVKIRTFGKLELTRDDKPVSFAGKTQKKPLELLQALISQGGCSVAEHRLADLLWPDSDGDAAYRALLTTTQRLRKLLGSVDAVRVQGGQVSLDSRICWLDTWAFDRLYQQARGALLGFEERRAISLLERVIALYVGPFLGQETDQHWMMARRESLRIQFLEAVTKLASAYEKAGAWDEAVQCYLRGLEIDELAEEFYRGLMICYGNLGNSSRALDIYRRCRNVLESGLGIEPSPETESVRQAVQPRKRG